MEMDKFKCIECGVEEVDDKDDICDDCMIAYEEDEDEDDDNET